MSLKFELPDGSVVSHAEGVTGSDIASAIGPGLAKAAVAISLDGELIDLTRPLRRGGSVEIVTDASPEGRSVLRHSAAHVLAQAVLGLYQDAKFAIGPPIEDGFYYDFQMKRPFTPEDLSEIQARMEEIVAEDQPFGRDELDQEAALELFVDQPFKVEIIESVDPAEVAGGGIVTVYRNNGFVDLCRGPHVPSTGRLKAVKLLRTAGAYWRGDETRPQLQRIYGTAWEDQKALAAYLDRLEEAERRDHRRLGNELDLYSFPQELGSGLAIWHPKGGMVRKVIEDYSRRIHEEFGFEFVNSPHLARSELWETSGHLAYYAESMYPAMHDGEQEYRVRPMNCPFHVLVYRSRGRSYRELPIRLSELGAVYRLERSGVLHGLLRARGFTQDDSHTFCTRDQLAEELLMHLEFVLQMMRDFGFDEFEADLSTRDESKWMGDLELWEEATAALDAALQAADVPYQMAEGEAAFYGPKIDVHLRDAIGRRWQMSTIQVDFALPENFDLGYATAENTTERPVMIHCAKAGAIERFVAVLVEHFAGAFPMWLAPVQVSIVPVADRHEPYAESVAEELNEVGLRVEVDHSDGTVGEKIRKALTNRHPAVLVVGDSDVEERTVGLRLRGEDHEERGVSLPDASLRLADMAEPPR